MKYHVTIINNFWLADNHGLVHTGFLYQGKGNCYNFQVLAVMVYKNLTDFR